MSIGANLHHVAAGGGSANSAGNSAIEYRSAALMSWVTWPFMGRSMLLPGQV
jgi:hypothetical protein